METEVKEITRDIRLYFYNGCSGMKKWNVCHNFDTVKDCEDYLSRLTIGYQFLIVEYSKAYNSRIVKIIN